MKHSIVRTMAGAAAALAFATASAAEITGAGATFPAPVYAKWAEAYKAATNNALNYQAIGSGGGVKQITAKTVDFGATDDPMSGEDLQKNDLVQFPAIIGGVVPIVNVEGVKPGEMKLSGEVLAGIFSGEIKKWDAEAISKLNPELKLPSTAITVVYRSDSSGTTAVFTDYLASVAPTFKDAVGAGKTVKWKSGVGGKGNAGVAANVQKLKGSIGYVEYAYAKQNRMSHVAMINKAGKVVQPEDDSFAAAAAKADWKSAPGFGASLNDQADEKAWPITSASFILVPKKPENPQRVAEALKFFDWAFANGDQLAKELDYVPIPEPVVEQIRGAWKQVTDASGKPLVAAK